MTEAERKMMSEAKMSMKERFEASVQLARERGVPEDRILKTKEDIDRYFRKGE